MDQDNTAEQAINEFAKDDPSIKIMPIEFGVQQPTHGEPVSYNSPQEQMGYARELLASGKVKVSLASEFDKSPLRDQLTAALLTSDWKRPDRNINNDLPLKGETGHRASSASVVVDINSEQLTGRFDIVSKPFSKPRKAEAEQHLLQELQRRGVNAIKPLGIIETNDEQGKYATSLSILKHGVVPLSAIRLEGIQRTRGDANVAEVIRSLGEYVAFFHNQGFTHGDLHVGNIGIDLNADSPQRFILFDPEHGHMLGDRKLREKKHTKGLYSPSDETFAEFERFYVHDSAELLAYLTVFNGDSFRPEFITDNFRSGYFSSRDRERGQLPNEEYIKLFDAQFAEATQKATTSFNYMKSQNKNFITIV